MGTAAEDRRHHLQLVQGVVTRLATNSFLVKGWSLTVASALFGFGATRSEKPLVALGLLVAVVFMILDAYYLFLERAFRNLYDDIRRDRIELFSLDYTKTLVGTPLWRVKLLGVLSTLGSGSIWLFYGPLLGAGAIILCKYATSP
jgi:hypothetical protein